WRIATGAPVPDGCDAVVPWEGTTEDSSGWVEIRTSQGARSNIVEIGEDIQQGAKVLAKGDVVTPEAIGVLAALGIGRIPVYRRPRIALISTGDELCEVGTPLPPGSIYNSGRHVMGALIRRTGAEV